MKNKKLINVTRIEWDAESDELQYLPKKIKDLEVDRDLDVDEYLADILTDHYEFCIKSLTWEDAEQKEAEKYLLQQVDKS